MPTKISFSFSKFSVAYYLPVPRVGTFTSVFKDKLLLRNKQLKSRFLSNFFIVDGSIRIRTVQIITHPDPGGPKTNGSASGTLACVLDPH
jgi:hypothetical protein